MISWLAPESLPYRMCLRILGLCASAVCTGLLRKAAVLAFYKHAFLLVMSPNLEYVFFFSNSKL